MRMTRIENIESSGEKWKLVPNVPVSLLQRIIKHKEELINGL
jgi:hypothetical protein